MNGITLDDVIEAVGTLKAQQQADASVIAVLVAVLANDGALDSAWSEMLPVSVVGESLYAQTNAHGKIGLAAFNERIAYWSGVIKAATASDT